jgi:hypothetical protein
MKTQRKMGRPPGKEYPIQRTMLLTEEDFATLQQLADVWGVSVAEAVRRSIRSQAEQHEHAIKAARIRDMQRRLAAGVPSVDEYLGWKREELEQERQREEAWDAART